MPDHNTDDQGKDGDTKDTNDTNSVLAELVGDGKKFKTVEDLAVGKAQSDAFINKLKDENKELRSIAQQLSGKLETLEIQVGFLTKVAKGDDESNDHQENHEPDDTRNDKNSVNQTKGLTADDVVSLIELTSQQSKIAANKETVRAALIKQFGADADKFVASKSEELGITKQELFDLAGKSPNGFYNLVGVSFDNPRNAGMSSYVAGHGDRSNLGGRPEVRNKAYYDRKRAEMGSVKYALDTTLQVQLHKDMEALGDKWDA